MPAESHFGEHKRLDTRERNHGSNVVMAKLLARAQLRRKSDDGADINFATLSSGSLRIVSKSVAALPMQQELDHQVALVKKQVRSDMERSEKVEHS